jgi:anti-anti-sigma regulatory factor
MNITISTEKGRVEVTVLHVHGNVDSSTYEAFEKRAGELIDAGARDLLIDLTNTPFMSSAGLRALNSLFYRLRAFEPEGSDEEMKQGIRDGTFRSQHLKLAGVNKDIRQTLEISGLDMYIDVQPDVPTALASF